MNFSNLLSRFLPAPKPPAQPDLSLLSYSELEALSREYASFQETYQAHRRAISHELDRIRKGLRPVEGEK